MKELTKKYLIETELNSWVNIWWVLEIQRKALKSFSIPMLQYCIYRFSQLPTYLTVSTPKETTTLYSESIGPLIGFTTPLDPPSHPGPEQLIGNSFGWAGRGGGGTVGATWLPYFTFCPPPPAEWLDEGTMSIVSDCDQTLDWASYALSLAGQMTMVRRDSFGIRNIVAGRAREAF